MPAPIRIGVNALYLIPGGVGGTEIYLRNLLAALARVDNRNQYFVFTNRETGEEICPPAANLQLVPTGVPARWRPARLLWEQTGLAMETFRYKLDVMFSPGFTSPLLSRGRKVTVIHDVQHKRRPENFGLFERLAWNASVWSSVRGSDALVTVSESSRRDIMEIYGVDPGKIRVIRHGVEPDFFGLRQNQQYGPTLPSEAGVPECRYLLAVSTVHPHKNWLRLLEAYEHLVKAGRPEHLVIVGLAGKAWNEVRGRLGEGALASRVHLLGWQPRRVVLGLFKFAELLVFPSTFEGFGLPVVEAMAAGIPVVCSDIPPLREIADGSAVFFDPASSPGIAEALRRVLEDADIREQAVESGLARASEFTWTHSAEQTLAVLLRTARR